MPAAALEQMFGGEWFRELQEFLMIYNEMGLEEMNSKFNSYNKKILKEIIPISKAKFTLSRMLILENQDS